MEKFKKAETKQKVEYIRKIKNDIIGSFKEKNRYWEDGLIETLLQNMDELESSPELMVGAYSIFVGYTNNFEEAYDAFTYKEDFLQKIVENMSKQVESKEDDRIVDLGMQIVRNLLVNNIVSHKKANELNLMTVIEKKMDNNKRINLVAQILSKLAKESEDLKNQIIEQKTILDSIIEGIDQKGSDSLRVSLLDCLINLSTNDDRITSYVRDSINIQHLISMIKFQNNEINAKVAYLATILNSESNLSGDFENLVKQIIFQITRMLQSSEDEEVLEATSMLYNLVKTNDNEFDIFSSKKTLGIHTGEVGAVGLLSNILGHKIGIYLEFLRNAPKPKSTEAKAVVNLGKDEDTKEEKNDAEEKDNTEAKNDTEEKKDTKEKETTEKIEKVDMETLVDDSTGNFERCRMIVITALRIVRSLMNANSVGLKKVITAQIPQHCFKLLDKIVGDELRILSCECLKVLARAKKKIKIQIMEDHYDLETQFKGLINDPNIEIQRLGMAIICNFSIDFPGMILTFKDFLPKVKEFLLQKEYSEMKFLAIKTIKNLLYAGHPIEVCLKAEKDIFKCIEIDQIYKGLDDPDQKVKEQAEIIFKNLHHISKKHVEEDKTPKSILESLEDKTMRDRIEELAKQD